MQSKWLKNSILLSGFAKISRILGMVRDNLCGRYFGTSPEFGAFTLAFRFPDLLRRLLEEGTPSSILLPHLQQEHISRIKTSETQIASHFFSFSITLCAIFVCCSLLGLVVVKHISSLTYDFLIIYYSLLLLPYIGILTLIILLNSLLYILESFFETALSPILFNAIWIIGILLAIKITSAPTEQIAFMCFTILIASVCQATFLFVIVKKKHWSLHYHPKYFFFILKKITAELLPMTINLSLSQVLLLLGSIALFFSNTNSHDLATLYYADRVQQLPIGIFALAITTAVFPALTRYHYENQHQDFKTQLSKSCRLLWFFILPSMIGICFLHKNIVFTLFSFKEHEATARTSQTLLFLNFGLFFTSTSALLTRAIYAKKFLILLNRSTISLVGVFCLCLFILFFSKYLRCETIAITISLLAVLQLFLLFYFCLKRQLLDIKLIYKRLISLLTPSLVLLLWLLCCHQFLERSIIDALLSIYTNNEYLKNLIYTVFVILSSISLYFYTAKLSNSDEWLQIKGVFSHQTH